MNPSTLSVVMGALFFATMAGYALFAGADFGGRIWDLLAGGSERGEGPRAAIGASVTPVWEGNNVWIVLGLVVFWTAFPLAFGATFTALFVPLALSLLGILFRGIGFAFRHEAERLPMKRLSGALFAASSLMAPFFLGAAVGAVATGRVPAHPGGNVWSAWLNPGALVTGVLFVSACAYIGGVYLVADSDRRHQPDLVRYFQRRAVVAGVVTGALAGLNLVLLRSSAPYVWHRLLGPALPAVLLSVVSGAVVAGVVTGALAGLNLVLLRSSGPYVWHRLLGPALPAVLLSVVSGAVALVLIVLNRPHLVRVAAAVAVIGVVAGWGIAQYPWLLPGRLSLADGSAPTSALAAELAVMGLAVLLVLPSFGYLYWLQQHGRLQDTESSDGLKEAVATENRADDRTGSGSGTDVAVRRRPPVLVVGAVVSAAVVELLRDVLTGGPAALRVAPPRGWT